MKPSTSIAMLREHFPRGVSTSHTFRGDATAILRPEALVEVARFLKEDSEFQMNFLVDVTAVDYSAFGKGETPAFFASSGVAVRPAPRVPEVDPWPGPPFSPGSSGSTRFAVVYHFYSMVLKHRLRLVVPVDDTEPSLDSLVELWPGANWLEREVWDMFGIHFSGHPDLRRILTYTEFEGHPLRKDYPIKKRQPLIGPLN